ncbi:GNAT family N-acetyltransferase [Desulfobulbus elongatus]|uniref:GNAT family N-acetyltransferase n=1 Tax=Desulfobulbus elongatus TaxID=53332 RepID=UPI000A056CAD|nr:GNAT family N-acetyltransferase [Desulfobulbus elongatus]
MGKLTAPAPIEAVHTADNFDCGISSLNQWIRQQALKNELSGASRTFVVCIEKEVVGYYALATGSILRQQAPGKIRREMPDPIPVMVLARLAVDCTWQKSGVGLGLLRDALLRTYNVSRQVGVRALLVHALHALSEKAKGFYLRHGFTQSPVDQMTLMLKMQDVRQILET